MKNKDVELIERSIGADFIVSFNTATKLQNILSGKKEDYLFETPVNGPLYQHNFIVKIVDAEFHTVEYDLYAMPVADYTEQLSLKGYMMAKCHAMSTPQMDKHEKEAIYYCPDTKEKYSWKEIINEAKKMISKYYQCAEKTKI